MTFKDTYGKIFYFPYRLERKWPSEKEAILRLLECLIHKQEITVYSTIELARQAGEEMLYDDDTYGILVMDFTRGFLYVYEPEDINKPHWHTGISFEIGENMQLRG